MLIDKIGDAAMLELLAEECTELAKASLKYARYLRNENPTFKDIATISDNLQEETADVLICMHELSQARIIIHELVETWKTNKHNRMKERFKDD